MAQYFDEAKWREFAKSPNWYLLLKDEYDAVAQRVKHAPFDEADIIKNEIRSFFEALIRENGLELGREGGNLDEQRKPIDTIVLHHTSSKPGYTLARMNAVHLLNLYVPYYQNPSLPEEQNLKGAPIWSNHFDGQGEQVFYAYHWLVRMDGTAERLLDDSAIGWHAGNWDINTRSVAICLDNDYESSQPSPEVLEAVTKIVRTHYPNVSVERIFGHAEVAQHTTICPGNSFVGGWKKMFLGLIETEK